MLEEWRQVCGWPAYEVSNLGKVRRAGRLMTPGENTCGYLIVMLSDAPNGRQKTARVHRLVAEAFIPNPDNLPEVNHIDGVKANPMRENLEWVTRTQNCLHFLAAANKKPDRKPLRGVDFKDGKWRSRITRNRKEITLGYFDCPAAACFAYAIASDRPYKEARPTTDRTRTAGER